MDVEEQRGRSAKILVVRVDQRSCCRFSDRSALGCGGEEGGGGGGRRGGYPSSSLIERVESRRFVSGFRVLEVLIAC